MYPQVFVDYTKMHAEFGDVTLLDTPTFFYGMRPNETIHLEIEKGKTLIITLDQIGESNLEGKRILFFTFNGQRREIIVKDSSIKSLVTLKQKAEPTKREHIGATMSGSVLEVLVKKGDTVKKGDPLLVTEAMKMETTIQATFDGEVTVIHVENGEPILSGDLLIEMREN